MKRRISILALFASFTAIAQEDSTTVYYDKKWQTTEDQQSAAYYRKAILKNDLWYANDYYKKSRSLRMSGCYKYGPDSVRDGAFVYYYEDGWKKEEGAYLNNERNGVWNGWNEDGKKHYVGIYKEGYLIGEYTSWYRTGGIYCKRHYLDDIAAVKASERTDSTGKKIRSEGKLWGTAVYYYPDGKMCAREEWKDSLIGMECWNEEGKPEPAARDASGNYLVQVLPKFDGDVVQFLLEHVKYPRISRKRREQGRTLLKFIVEKNGQVRDVTVERTSGFPLLDEEAKRVTLLTNGKWHAGRQHNIPVKAYCTLPITFLLP